MVGPYLEDIKGPDTPVMSCTEVMSADHFGTCRFKEVTGAIESSIRPFLPFSARGDLQGSACGSSVAKFCCTRLGFDAYSLLA